MTDEVRRCHGTRFNRCTCSMLMGTGMLWAQQHYCHPLRPVMHLCRAGAGEPCEWLCCNKQWQHQAQTNGAQWLYKPAFGKPHFSSHDAGRGGSAYFSRHRRPPCSCGTGCIAPTSSCRLARRGATAYCVWPWYVSKCPVGWLLVAVMMNGVCEGLWNM